MEWSLGILVTDRTAIIKADRFQPNHVGLFNTQRPIILQYQFNIAITATYNLAHQLLINVKTHL